MLQSVYRELSDKGEIHPKKLVANGLLSFSSYSCVSEAP